MKAEESVVEIPCVTSLKTKFEALFLPEFWNYIKKCTWNRGVISFWKDISVWKKNSALTAIKSMYPNSL